MPEEPISYQIEDPPGILRMVLSGDLYLPHFIAHVDIIREDPGYHQGLVKLVDTTRVMEFHLKGADLSRYISYKQVKKCVERRVAILAQDDHTFGMSRMYELLAGSIHPDGVRAFRDEEGALQWLCMDV